MNEENELQVIKRQGHSGLSIAAIILTLLGCTSLIGFILAIIDLANAKKDSQKHNASIISIVIFGIGFVIALLFGIIFAAVGQKSDHKESDTVYEQKEDYSWLDDNSDISIENQLNQDGEKQNDSDHENQVNASNDSHDEDQNRDNNEISAEFKKQVDDLESFYNEYCDFMEKYTKEASTGDVTGMLTDYMKFLGEYEKYAKDLDDMNNNQDNMTQAELNYFLDAYNRIMKRLANTSYTVK